MTTPVATPSIDAPSYSFATRLREHTQSEHTRAENAPFMTELMGGTGSISDYVALVSQYVFIYDALERVGEQWRDDAAGSAFVDDALLRREALALDLEHFLGADWRSAIAPTDAAAAYVARIESVGARSSAEYVAHHYIRFLGDLSGGQIIRVMVQRHYGIPVDGLNFLDFPLIPKPKPYKDNYRAALDAAPWTEAERDALIAEVDVAFGLNYDLFMELGRVTRA